MKRIFCKFLIPVILFFVNPTLSAQIITTVAGNGVAGYSGNGGAATAAELYNPYMAAMDASGNIIFVDANNKVVRKIDNMGIITAIAGGGTSSSYDIPATDENIIGIRGIAVDGSGNIYVSNYSNSLIYKVNTSGIITKIAGSNFPGYSGDGGAATNAQIDGPMGLATDATGNIYFADALKNVIRKITTSGIITTVAGIGSSTGGYTGDGAAATLAHLSYPLGVTVDASGNIYIADANNGVIRKVNTFGIISTVAGSVPGYSGDNGPATAAKMAGPSDVGIDGSGNLFIADYGNSRIRMVNTAGIITTIAGNGIKGYIGDGAAATAAELWYPNGVTLNSSGSLYIMDGGNNVIRKVNTGTVKIDETTNSKSGLILFPNPNNGLFTLKGSVSSLADQNVSISISNMLGQVIYTNSIRPQKKSIDTQINLNGSADGLYLLHIRSESENEVLRFVVEK
jgi:trimeric autotransporter adhesin